MIDMNKWEDCSKLEDVDVLDELIKIQFSNNKVIIINRQASLEEIWLSSPISGPVHY